MTDSRPRIAIIGAGPTGLEAALAAREMGLDVDLYESSPHVGGGIRRWGHVRLFTPWSMNVSPRARRWLGAAAPDGTECPTGKELVERLLEPIGAHGEIAPAVHLGTRVVAVGRDGLLKHEEIGTPARGRTPFRLLVEGPAGERITRADVVLDCSGSLAVPNPVGDGGIPAPGERAVGDAILHDIPGPVRLERLAGHRILLVGGGHSGQTAARDLAALTERHPATRVHWLLRRRTPGFTVPDDPLPARAELGRRAEVIAAGGAPGVTPVPGAVVEAIERKPTGLLVSLRGLDGEDRSPLEVDRIVALTGSVGDHTLYRQLQVHECYATSGPMKLAAALLGQGSADCLAQTGHGPETLSSPEPDFYLLGSKSYGRNATFLLRVGWDQVDDVVQLITGS